MTSTPALPALTPNAHLRYDVIARWVDQLQPSSVLEFGVGLGAVGARLAQRRAYRGVEPDDTSRAAANAVMPPSGTVTAEVDDVDDGTIELVCAFEVLEHIPDDVAALTDWTRYLAPGGHVLASVPAWPHRFAPHDTRAGHLRRYSPDMLRDLATAAGLDVVAVEPIGFPLGLVLETIRNRAADGHDDVDDAATATAASARIMQPKPWMRAATAAGTWPFRMVQRAVHPAKWSTGFVLVARKPLV